MGLDILDFPCFWVRLFSGRFLGFWGGFGFWVAVLRFGFCYTVSTLGFFCVSFVAVRLFWNLRILPKFVVFPLYFEGFS